MVDSVRRSSAVSAFATPHRQSFRLRIPLMDLALPTALARSAAACIVDRFSGQWHDKVGDACAPIAVAKVASCGGLWAVDDSITGLCSPVVW